MKRLKVGEVAKQASVSVRTLHHYDNIGLVKPSDASESGHRLYNANDIERLQQVISFRSMGLSLSDIATLLKTKDARLESTLMVQRDAIEKNIADLQIVHRTLKYLLNRMQQSKGVTTQDLLKLMKEMNEMENTWNKLYTPEQIKSLQERYNQYPDQVKDVEKAWPELFKQFEEALQSGLDPASKEVQALAKRAQHFIDLFTGGDKAIEANLDKAYQQNQSSALKTWGVSAEVFEYATKARQIFNNK